MNVIGIIGYGMVGRAVHHGFAQQADFRIYDVKDSICENTFKDTIKDSDFIFVAVPTPMKSSNEEFDSSIMDETIDKINKLAKGTDKIVIIKSTILPGTIDRYNQKYPETTIVFSPEFLTARSAKLDFINPSRIIFGLKHTKDEKMKEVINRIYNLYSPRFPGQQIHFTDARTAEMVKYISNCFLSTKVVFFNEMKQICDKLGLKYDRVIKYVLMDGRIGNSHWEVPGHDGDYGIGGLCFPKDLNALKQLAKDLDVEPTILEAVWKKNLEVRKNRDWEEIEGAVSDENE